ncbi:MAG TPA: DNA alkylation repair protein [Syntrophorhabdaceae bacterium]|nr:DNA alkylation repair protein [Syntrophorhabdaceae bacterium]
MAAAISNMPGDVHRRIRALGNEEKAKILQRFFKTGPGQYGEGDRFLGVAVPQLRRLAASFPALAEDEIAAVLHSPFHEERLFALLCMMAIFKKADGKLQRRIYDMYLANTRYINNWDLVDISAPHIVGAFLQERQRDPLYRLAVSESLWERRIAIIATLHFIRRSDLADTFGIARLLLGDREDLIRKAVGWMLREAGKRDLGAEESFLEQHAGSMPRTMLRYAIERLPEARRLHWLKRKGPNTLFV